MTATFTDQGLQRIGINASQATGFSSSRYFRTMSVDDSANAIATTDTAANSGGAVTNFYDQAFDGTPTRLNQTITHEMTVPVGSGNYTIRRILTHDDTVANVTTSSTTLGWGVDGQTFAKTSDFTLKFILKLTFSQGP